MQGLISPKRFVLFFKLSADQVSNTIAYNDRIRSYLYCLKRWHLNDRICLTRVDSILSNVLDSSDASQIFHRIIFSTFQFCVPLPYRAYKYFVFRCYYYLLTKKKKKILLLPSITMVGNFSDALVFRKIDDF